MPGVGSQVSGEVSGGRWQGGYSEFAAEDRGDTDEIEGSLVVGLWSLASD